MPLCLCTVNPINKKECAMDDVEQSSGLLMIGMMSVMAVLVGVVVVFGWLLWELGQAFL